MSDLDRAFARIAMFGLDLLAHGLNAEAWAVGWSLSGHGHPRATAAGLAIAQASEWMPAEWKR